MLHRSLLLFLLSTVLVLQLSMLAAAAPLEKRGTSGKASFYNQGGATGACGQVHSDDDYIVALGDAHYDGGKNCGRKIKVQANDGAGKGRSVVLTVADRCESCEAGHLDCAVAPFDYLAAGKGQEVGIIAVSWELV